MQLFLFKHNNKRLFSDHYLSQRITKLSEWNEADVSDKLALVQKLWHGFKGGSPNESVTEDKWIRPILALLGHHYKVQVSLRTPQGTKAPDYVLFSDKASADSFGDGTKTEADFGEASGLCEAKKWDRSLDKTSGKREGLSENPALQTDFYMRHSGVTWGILTNGRKWRLYHKGTSKHLDVYYEVDLIELIESEDNELFKFFWLFFQCDAFYSDSHKISFLEKVLTDSRAYEKGVSDNLKTQVYDALRKLVQGFIDYPDNKFDSGEQLDAIYDNSLIVLYRILFVLYAESRELLPVQSQLYRENYSFDSLKKDVAHDIDHGRGAAVSINRTWKRLQELWSVIDKGNDELGVPAYNGGLFDGVKHPFLENCSVGDSHLRQAIDLLARVVDEQTLQREFVDYSDLEVRHLGSIYEGLLEYQVRRAEKPLVITKKKKKEVYKAVSEADDADIQVGEIYLVTDKGERKASGSYYTPDHIVSHIVEQTIRPIMDGVLEKHTTKDAVDENALVTDMMALNILDPAMGSGHFLVSATDFMAVYMVDLGLSSEMWGDNSKAYWMRRIAQSCIYGVDLNRLAVDLAKLSLWLITIDKNKPLSFLKHHLRWGNTLIGAHLTDVVSSSSVKKKSGKKRSSPNTDQMSLLNDDLFAHTIQEATNSMTQIEILTGDTVEEIKEAERIYRHQVRVATETYRQLCNVWTARDFGLDIDHDTWRLLFKSHSNDMATTMPEYKRILQQTADLEKKFRFFHWELEFPEVFFDRSGKLQGDAGFDAVIGNPPYDVMLRTEGEKTAMILDYIKAQPRLKDSLGGRLNIFRVMMLQAVGLLKANAYIGQIVPLGILGDKSSYGARKHLLDNVSIFAIDCFPQKDDPNNRVFPDAKLSTCVFIGRKGDRTNEFILRVHPGRYFESSDNILINSTLIEKIDPEYLVIPLIASDQEASILRKLHTDTIHFSSVSTSKQGEVNMSNHRNCFTDSERGAIMIKGSEVARYKLQPPSQGQQQKLDRNLFEQRTTRMDDTKKERIVTQHITGVDDARRITAYLLEPHIFCGNSLNYTTMHPPYQNGFGLILLNSKLLDWRFRATSSNNNVNAYEIDALPIPNLEPYQDEADQKEVDKIVNAMIQDYHKGNGQLLASLDGLSSRMRNLVANLFLDWVGRKIQETHKSVDEEINSFLDWIRDFLNSDIATWQSKSKLKRYHLLIWDDFRDILFRNGSRILEQGQIDVKSRSTLQKVKSEFMSSQMELNPRIEELTQMENLADLVVYKLYQLTSDEIAIVEGKI